MSILVFNLQGNLINSLGNEGSGNGEFNRPSGIACDANGDLYVSDTLNHSVCGCFFIRIQARVKFVELRPL